MPTRPWSVAPVLVVLGACADASTPPASPRAPAAPQPAVGQRAPSAVAPTAAPPAVDPDAELRKTLAEGAVHDGSFARRVLYTWTTLAQVGELYSKRVLLTRTRSSDGKRSLFDRRLERAGTEVAKLLLKPELSLRRFAWTNAWATRLGFEGESYGNRLIRVSLHADAIIGRLSAAGDLDFVDLRGNPVAERTVLDQPHRLAAVYHVWDGNPHSFGGPRVALREYVLINESMIETWELETPLVEHEHKASEHVARQILESTGRGPWATRPAAAGLPKTWTRTTPLSADAPIEDLYEANLAFAGDGYRPTRGTLAALTGALADRKTSRGPILHHPTVHFRDQKPGWKPKPKPKPPRPPMLGSMW